MPEPPLPEPLPIEVVRLRPYLTVTETAAFLCRTRETVRRYLDNGDLAFTMLRGRRAVLVRPLLDKFGLDQ